MFSRVEEVMFKRLMLSCFLILLPVMAARSQQFMFNDPMAGPICSGPLGLGPCADVMRYLQQGGGGFPGGGFVGPGAGGGPPGMGGLPGAGMFPQDAQIVAMIGQRCGGQPVCMAGAWGAVEIQRCRNDMFVPGGCFGPNGEIIRVLNRVLPQNLQPQTIITNVQSDLQNGPGRNNDLVGCNGALPRLFGSRC
jgi:hypothetical protein